jgi:CelD/BcsL family acetyltransferase involved in cellulose biosynthesis
LKTLRADILRPGELGAAELGQWAAFVEAARLPGPYFAPEYTLAADGVVPGAQVAVLHRGGKVEGFLPFQRRGGMIQPLGAPLTDYHGLVAPPGARIDLPWVIRLLGASTYRFGGLRTPGFLPGGLQTFEHEAMAADVSGGLEAYLQARPKTRKFFKEKDRRLRALDAEVGPVEFRLEDDDPALFDFVLKHKRAQYERTGRHDIFGCGWTERFLRRLWEIRTPEFGARFASLRVSGQVAAAELGLRGGRVHHLWFPTYDPALQRYGPGTTLMIQTVRAAAEHPGLDTVDFGAGGECYKHAYAEPSGLVHAGAVHAASWRRASLQVADAAFRAHPALTRVAHLRDRVDRRLQVIGACETTTRRWVAGAVEAFRCAGRRGAGAEPA